MTKLTFDAANSVTRFDVRETEDGDEIRLFHKRAKLFGFGVDDITRDDWETELAEFIKTPRTSEECEEFLTTDAEEGEDDEERDTGSVVPEKYRVIYGSAQNCGDEIALALTAFVTLPRATKKDADGGLDRAKLRAVAEVNGIGDKLADWEERGLNGGLLRMNTSNVLRGMNRRGEEVRIGDTVWAAREVPKKARKSRAKKG